MEEGRSSFKILTGKPTGKRPLGRPRRRWEDNIRMDLEEIGINAGNWVDSDQLESPCECGIEPPGSISHGVVSPSRRKSFHTSVSITMMKQEETYNR